ncbi:MAG: metal-binding protein SmbP [Nitrospirota bacterium]|nr:MAG: metal-binding protein SmbP [Nitrospirota bacterium]
MHRMRIHTALLASIFLSVLFMVLCTSPVLAGNPHVDEAIAHAQGAAKHGGMGHADALVEHAEEALMHAQAAQKEVNNPHLDEGVRELQEAIKHGKKGHAEEGTKHAKSAVMHLKEVN